MQRERPKIRHPRDVTLLELLDDDLFIGIPCLAASTGTRHKDHEVDVVPHVVFPFAVVLEVYAVLLELILVQSTDETDVVFVLFYQFYLLSVLLQANDDDYQNDLGRKNLEIEE